jgi:four helix bundle protein
MKSSVLKEKSFNFAIRIVNIYKFLSLEKKEYVLSKQILRSGTAIGAMVMEGNFAESKPDFIHKFAIAQKECNETLYWIELLYKTQYVNNNEYLSIQNDAKELNCLLSSSILTAKKSLKK